MINSEQDETVQQKRLVELFGNDIVEQARLIDVVDLNLNDSMTSCISAGVTSLKQLRGDPSAQHRFVAAMQPGEQLLLCMWVLEMELLDKIRE